MHSAKTAAETKTRTACLLCALAFTLAGLAWQLLTVHYNYRGNLTGLFCTGSRNPTPPALLPENIYTFADSNGYDGQFYHYVAHDPFLRGGMDRFMDMPSVRYHRILTPGLAFLMAAGRPGWIDTAYLVVNLVFLFLGAWWVCRYFVLMNSRPWPGVLFLLTPAALISLDRLTIDLSTTALCVGAALYYKIESPRKLYAVLALAGLSRETGAFLTIAYCISLLLKRRFVQAAAFSTAILPAALWYLFVDSRTKPVPSEWSDFIPLQGIAGMLINPVHYPFTPLVNGVSMALDYSVWIGLLLASALAFRLLYKQRTGFVEIAISIWAIVGLCLPRIFWEDCCSSGRVFSPLLALLFLRSLEPSGALSAVPLILVSPRTWFQLLPELSRILRGLLGLN